MAEEHHKVNAMVNLDASLNGILNAGERFDRAAGAIAQASLPVAPAETTDSVSLSDAMVALLQARNAFQANVRAEQSMDQMSRNVLNLAG